jgi:hypothetical protein
VKAKPDSPFIFHDDRHDVSGWGRMKDRLDAAMLPPRARRATRPFRRGRCMT